MKELSVGEYAASRRARGLPGGTRRAVQKAIETDRISMAVRKDGQGRFWINPPGADREWEANTGRPRGGALVSEGLGHLEKEGGAGGSEMADLPPMSKKNGKSPLTLIQAQTAKAEGEAHLKRLQVRRLEGELVDRERVQGFVFRLFRSERDAWMSWPARVDGQIAGQINAILANNGGITQREVNLILDGHVRQHLTELGKIDLDQIEADKEAA